MAKDLYGKSVEIPADAVNMLRKGFSIETVARLHTITPAIATEALVDSYMKSGMTHIQQ